MPKQKTHKGLAKRVRVTRTGKIMRGHAGGSHLLSNKSRKRKRKLRSTTTVAATDLARTKRALD